MARCGRPAIRAGVGCTFTWLSHPYRGVAADATALPTPAEALRDCGAIRRRLRADHRPIPLEVSPLAIWKVPSAKLVTTC